MIDSYSVFTTLQLIIVGYKCVGIISSIELAQDTNIISGDHRQEKRGQSA